MTAPTRTQQPGLAGVARGGLANVVGGGFAAGAGLGVAWLVARGLGPAPAGVFFASVATFGVVAGVAKLGTPTGLVYWLARLRTEGRADLLGGCLRVAIAPVAAASLLAALGLWLAAPALGTAIGGPAQAGTAATVLRTLALFLPFAALTDAALSATRGYRLMQPTVTLEKLLRPALQLAMLSALAVAALWTSTSAAAWSLAWAVPFAPVLVLAGYALRRAHPYRWRGRGIGRAFWGFTAPRAVASVLQLALQRVDIILVAVLAGPVPAAVYTVAGRFVVLGQLANQAIGYPIQPRLAERLSAGDLAGTAALYRATTAWLVLATWPLYLVVAGYAPVYLGLFGDSYRSGGTVVVILAAAMLLASACGTVDMLLAMAGRTSWNLGNVALALATMVGLTVALVPRLGATGAAVGLAAAVAVNNLLPLAQVARSLRIHPFGRGTLAAAGLAAGCFGLLPAVSAAVAGTSGPAVAGTLTVALVLYLAGARRLRHLLALDVLVAAWTRRRNGETHAP